jgi:tRNA U34 2-thiouridine synthase MnmA/TrmU
MLGKTAKALLLFSGGLDSLLAAKILQEQGIEVEAVFFKSYFFDIKKISKNLGFKLRIADISDKQFEIVKNPKYGYGKNMNPCIDCHLLMFKEAKKLMEKEGFDFIATGEVLDERPMSQNKKSLALIEKESGLTRKVLRPLSAKLLEPTDAEKKGIVDRDELYFIKGKSRKKQIELAKKFKIKDYLTPAGGCLLTDPEFSKKLKELLDKNKDVSKNDLELLYYGRHFWHNNVKIVVGRDEHENKEIEKLKQEGDVLIELKNIPGPMTLVRGKDGQAIEKAKELTKYYSLKARDKKQVEFKIC